MRMIKTRLRRLPLPAALAAALFGCATDPYGEAVEQIRARYVEPVGEERLGPQSLKEILTGLDPHSDYLDPAAYRSFVDDARGEYSGIGVLLGDDRGRFAVAATLMDGP